MRLSTVLGGIAPAALTLLGGTPVPTLAAPAGWVNWSPAPGLRVSLPASPTLTGNAGPLRQYQVKRAIPETGDIPTTINYVVYTMRGKPVPMSRAKTTQVLAEFARLIMTQVMGISDPIERADPETVSGRPALRVHASATAASPKYESSTTDMLLVLDGGTLCVLQTVTPNSVASLPGATGYKRDGEAFLSSLQFSRPPLPPRKPVPPVKPKKHLTKFKKSVVKSNKSAVKSNKYQHSHRGKKTGTHRFPHRF